MDYAANSIAFVRVGDMATKMRTLRTSRRWIDAKGKFDEKVRERLNQILAALKAPPIMFVET